MTKVAQTKPKTQKKPKVNPSEDNSNEQQIGGIKLSNLTPKMKVRIGVGLFFLMVGSYIAAAIVGYCLSWKQDMDQLLGSQSIGSFLFDNEAPIANFCGRLGAAISHALVYNAFGISAIAIAIFLMAFGWNIVNKKSIFPLYKIIKWLCFSILFFAPLLSFCFPNATFPVGGFVGNSLIEWTSGFAGKAGVIIMLLEALSFFIFVVFEWPVQQLLVKLKSYLPEVKDREVAESPEADSVKDQFKGYTNPPAAVDPEFTVTSNNDNAQTIVSEYNPPAFEPPAYIEEEEEDGSLAFEYKVVDDHSPSFDLTNDELDQINQASELHINIPNVDLSNYKTTKISDKSAPKDIRTQQLEDAEFEINMPKAEDPHFEVASKKGITLEVPQQIENPKFNVEHLAVSYEEVKAPTNHFEPITLDEPPFDVNEVADEANNDADKFEIREQVKEEIVPLHGKHMSIGEPYDPMLDLPDYEFPSLDLLSEIDQNAIAIDREELERNNNQIRKTLSSFGLEIQKISATVGPTVTLYEIVPAEGVRISKIKNLEDDIALSLSALGIRIIAPIPGKGTIGIEVPNTKKQIVSMRSLLQSEKFVNTTMSLPIAFGKKIDNENYIVDLATMPHLLMAGATGQGKSVGINAILVSLLYKKHPSQLKFVMVDPKKVELSIYRTIEKHYLAMLPNEEEAIITDTKKVVNTLNALCIEMDNRYELLKDAGTRNIKEYNEKFTQRRLNPQHGHKYLPFIVLVIDEFADLIMTAGKEVEMPIARLAQLARAIGIHLIVATQRPSVNVITGIIKANFPARVAFKVSSKIDSRTILDAGGADQLIGRGDMLVSNGSELIRLQCAFVDTPEVERIVEHIGAQRGYSSAFMLPEYEGAESETQDREDVDLSKRDKMFEEAARLVVSSQSGSTSMLQRKFNLGYNRAGRIMDQLEAAGIVGPTKGSKPREVLIHTEYELENLLEELF